MAEVKTQPVRGRQVDIDALMDAGLDALRENAGGFEFVEHGGRVSDMLMICPCGCGNTGALAIRPAPSPSPSWDWDGNRDAPTLTPSVHHVGHWHGWLKAAVWESC